MVARAFYPAGADRVIGRKWFHKQIVKPRQADPVSPSRSLARCLAANPSPETTYWIRNRLGWMFHYVMVILLIGLGYEGMSRHVISTVRVSGTSMLPTLTESGVHLLHRWVYLWRNPRPQDIVVINDPADNGLSIKRILAGPGDFVALRGGRVYVNGRLLNEPYLRTGTETLIDSNQDAQWMAGCRAGEYLLLGDNRGVSADSRQYGVVTRDRICGVVFPAGLR